ncbi:MAG: AAA family ATPase [Anaerolineae bacterium]
MKVITLSNEKGGVGKTTLAIHLAAGLAVKGHRVLLIDADAQANATSGLGLKEEPGLYDLLVRDAAWQDVLRVLQPEIYEPPNHPATGMLAVLPGNGETQSIAQRLDDAYAIHERLEELEDAIDYVIFDTSPTPSLLHGIIYVATDAILFPTLCETFSLQGLIKTVQNRERFANNRKKELGRSIRMLGIVPMMYRNKTVEHSENLAILQDQFGGMVWTPVPLRITWSEATTMRRTVFSIDPTGLASRDAWQVVLRAEKDMAHAQ